MPKTCASRWTWIGLCMLAVAAWMATPSVGIQESPEHAASDEPARDVATVPAEGGEGAGGTLRYREGTRLVNRVGVFRAVGDRVIFTFTENRQQFAAPVLENLMLDRVWRVLNESPDPAPWTVSGTVTEYRGDNYLILSRAVMKARSVDDSPAAPRP